jgi:hydroxymethylpyrimidine pyrophosphatase-like HAD family hydrolase
MGLRTVLVSGRRYPELVKFAEEFGAFDAIVAENGAVVEAPLGTPPSVVGRRTAARLRRRLEGFPSLHDEWGEVIVSVPTMERRRLLRAIDRLPVHVVANVDRLMVLPEQVTKRTGTRKALRLMGLAKGAYAAIGDAENDIDLLRGASLSGAVANAVLALQREADYVCRSSFEAGVLEFVRGPISRRVGRSRHEPHLNGAPRARAPAPRPTAC